MRIAAIDDIHANLPALEAVIAEIAREEVDGVLVGGDVLPGPMPLETPERLEGLDVPVQFIYGNGEVAPARTVGGQGRMPFGNAGADWLLLGPEVRLRPTRYDLGQAAERTRGTNYPQAEDFAANSILDPPSEQAMLEVFSRVALR